MMNNQNQNSTLILVMIVVVAIVAGWMLLISPARSDHSKAQDDLNAVQKKLHPPAPRVAADANTETAAGVATQPLVGPQLKKTIQAAATKVKLVTLKPKGSGYRIQIAGTMPSIASFFKRLATVSIADNAQITATAPLIVIKNLSISNSPASGTVATALLLPYQ